MKRLNWPNFWANWVSFSLGYAVGSEAPGGEICRLAVDVRQHGAAAVNHRRAAAVHRVRVPDLTVG
jgi:hypothetical protein